MRFLKSKLPTTDERLDSVAIIMDGNGRWATRRGLPREAGHIAGAKIITDVLAAFREANIHYVTLYAFSTENWKRPEREVSALFDLLYKYLDEVVAEKIRESGNLSVRFLGDLSPLPQRLREKCLEIENMAKNREFVCSVALNYGGRDEIVHAASAAATEGEISKESLSRCLYTYGAPDPDLVIRTAGEMRVSNFLLWQSAYSELIFIKTLWPDFGRRDIAHCIREFYKRKRTYGGLGGKSAVL